MNRAASSLVLCRFVTSASLLLHAGCSERTGTLGAFLGDASIDARSETRPCGELTLPSPLPLSGATGFAELPATLQLGTETARLDFSDNLSAVPGGWETGTGSYSSSLSEFGPPGVAIDNETINLVVKAKDAPNAGTTLRPYWGGELSSPATFGVGVFVAKVRSDGWQGVQSSFFFANDYVDASGKNLGWNGAILEFTHDGQRQQLAAIVHQSSTGRHDTQTVQIDVPSTRVMTLGLVALPDGQVGFYVDGQRVWDAANMQLPPTLSFRFTHWINASAATYTPSPTPVVFALDFVAHYRIACAY